MGSETVKPVGCSLTNAPEQHADLDSHHIRERISRTTPETQGRQRLPPVAAPVHLCNCHTFNRRADA